MRQTDITRQEQVAACFRFAAKDQIYEEFSGPYQISDKRAATLAKVARDVTLRLQLDPGRLSAQCYEGAANMSREREGVQALLKGRLPLHLHEAVFHTVRTPKNDHEVRSARFTLSRT